MKEEVSQKKKQIAIQIQIVQLIIIEKNGKKNNGLNIDL
jgi:hypothetical protein